MDPKEAESRTEGQRVLLSEDDPEMRAILVLALRKEGYDVTPCPDGVALVDRLGAVLASEDREYQMIISDIRMPGLDALEVLEGLSGWHDVPPVILITAFGDEATRNRARRLGAAAVIDKPFEIDDFLAEVRELMPPRPDAGE